MWSRSSGGRSLRLRARVKQCSLGLLSPVLKGLTSVRVLSKCGPGKVTGISPRSGRGAWSRASLARLPGTICNRLCLCALVLCWVLAWCCSALWGHVRLWKVIRISQSPRITTLRCIKSLL